MRDLLNKGNEECEKLVDLLEDSAEATARVESVEALLEALPPAQRTHAAACSNCREAIRDVVGARALLRGTVAQGHEPGPWFITRVMAAIAAKEKELSEVTRTWLAVPKFALRLALASCAVLLLASTWVFESRSTTVKQSNTLAPQESLFEAPQSSPNQDDILVSVPERNP